MQRARRAVPRERLPLVAATADAARSHLERDHTSKPPLFSRFPKQFVTLAHRTPGPFATKPLGRAAARSSSLVWRYLMSLTLHYHPLASFCQKVLIGLYEAALPFHKNLVDLSDPRQ